MEQFKIDIYKKETNKDFGDYEALSSHDRLVLIGQIRNMSNVGLSEKLFPAIENKLNYRDFNEDFTFDLKAVFSAFNLLPEDKMFVIWDENHIDKFDGRFLFDNWRYIWYGTSDDAVLLYFEKRKELLLIQHYGRIGSLTVV